MPIDLTNEHHRLQLRGLIDADIDEFSLQYDDGPRKHLGASMIGEPCERYLWYSFRWMFYKRHEPRMLRLFQRGHREELLLWAMLRSRGWTILDVDPTTGKQWRVSFAEGHGGGSMDAIGKPPARYGLGDEWFLMECKTNKSGDSSAKWKALTKNEMQSEKPLHWAQACTYGYLKGLRNLIYYAVNKDDDRNHIEPRQIDHEYGKRMVDKGTFVILQQTPPPKLHDNMSHTDCKYCDARDICHKGEPILRNCRSCWYASPGMNATWNCNYHCATIPENIISTGCSSWKGLPQ